MTVFVLACLVVIVLSLAAVLRRGFREARLLVEWERERERSQLGMGPPR